MNANKANAPAIDIGISASERKKIARDFSLCSPTAIPCT